MRRTRRLPEGAKQADPGDWIISSAAGELDTCKPDAFDASYERAEGEAEAVREQQ